MIEIENLRKVYGQFEAVKGISFKVHRGEILGFLGPNGAGKSTTMKVMTGLIPPTSGVVRIAGYDVLDDPLEVRRAIGYLPEVPPIYPEMVVRDYLNFAAEIRAVPRNRRKAAVDAAIERCGLAHMQKRLVGNLSKGYRQRVGLAQAVVHEPRILILDEPTVGLDPTQVIEIRGIVKQIGQERTVILSSHVLPEVEATCQRVVIINHGEVVARGPIEELLRQGGDGRAVIGLLRPPAQAEALTSIPGVVQAEAIRSTMHTGPGRLYRIDISVEGKDPAAAREEVIRQLANSEFGLFEVKNETTSLEQVFRQVVLEEGT